MHELGHQVGLGERLRPRRRAAELMYGTIKLGSRRLLGDDDAGEAERADQRLRRWRFRR